MTRQVVLDTETTGMPVEDGHQIINIGCVELIDRNIGRKEQFFIKPEREIDDKAYEVHGLSAEFLADKPLFKDIKQGFEDFLEGAEELLIHNAPFDMAFLDAEFIRLPQKAYKDFSSLCEDKNIKVVDTLALARRKHPGQRNSLDALCRRYSIDNSQRDLHNALLDAEILADVYLKMTGGQSALSFDSETTDAGGAVLRRLPSERPPLPVMWATAEDLNAHGARLAAIAKESGKGCLWLELDGADGAAASAS